MPELPEIETVKEGLRKYIIGHVIKDIEVFVPKIFQGDKKDLVGAKFIDVKRIGKGIIIELSNGYSLAVHLKLTGQLVYVGNETTKVKLSDKTGGRLPSRFTHVIFSLDNDSKLYYNDLRKFGWLKVVKSEEILNLPFFKKMGPEPKVTQKTSGKDLDLATFKEIVKKGNLPIKVLIMDQKRIGGIGNIYANDALFKARIDPRRKGKDLTEKELEKLYESILSVLKEGLKYGGSSDVNFVNVTGEEGSYQDHTLVYGRKGQSCANCKGKVEKIQLGGRGTYFCPKCQR